MDYMDCKGLSEAAEISERALKTLFLAGCRLDGGDLTPGFYELLRRRTGQLAAYERASAIFLAGLSKTSWSPPADAGRDHAYTERRIANETQHIQHKGVGQSRG